MKWFDDFYFITFTRLILYYNQILDIFFKFLPFICFSEALEFFSLLEPNRIKHELEEFELFRCFLSSAQSNQTVLLHLNDFYDFKLVKTSKYWKCQDSARSNWFEVIRFDLQGRLSSFTICLLVSVTIYNHNYQGNMLRYHPHNFFFISFIWYVKKFSKYTNN